MKIEILYPEIADLYGDKFNITYLSKCISDVEIIETKINETPYFVDHKVDMIYMGPLKERHQSLVINRLKPYKDKIRELIEKDIVFLFTGNAFEILGQKINNEEALGIFDYYSSSDLLKHESGCYLAKFNDIDIVGFISRYSQTYNIDKPLFKITKCNGLDDLNDGYHYHNFFATYSIGPLLIYNPLFTEYILKILNVKFSIAYQENIINAYKARLKCFNDKDISIIRPIH